jgi:homoserine kinase
MKEIRLPRPGQRFGVRVPATTANLGPGFDALGMAVGLEIDLEFTAVDSAPHEIVTEIIGEGSDYLPRTANNMIYKSAQELALYLGCQLPPLTMKVTNRIPLSRGLGSSASAIVGGLCCANLALGSPVDNAVILRLATGIEGHPDNVAPALLGGQVVSTMDNDEVRYIRLEPPTGLVLVVAIPSFPLSTHAARGALPGMLMFSDAVFNISRSSLLVAALNQGRFDLLRCAMDDKIHQPYRKKLVPGMEDVFKAALDAGAHGVALSGAGPSLIAFATESPEAIGKAMSEMWAFHGIDSSVFITRPSSRGTEAIDYGDQ